MLSQTLMCPPIFKRSRTFLSFVGLHSVIGTERNWQWFKMMLGGTFVWHAKFQPLNIKVIDKGHRSAAGMPSVWTKEDEFYFMKEMYPGIRVVMAHDVSLFKGNEQDMEIYVAEKHATEIISISKGFDVDARIIGRVENAPSKKVTLKTEFGEFNYE